MLQTAACKQQIVPCLLNGGQQKMIKHFYELSCRNYIISFSSQKDLGMQLSNLKTFRMHSGNLGLKPFYQVVFLQIIDEWRNFDRKPLVKLFIISVHWPVFTIRIMISQFIFKYFIIIIF
jgi:hypothetical protein